MLIKLSSNDYIAIGVSPDGRISLSARWCQAFGWSRFPASMPAAWLQVTVGFDAPCRWCVDGRKPDRTALCPHCRGTRTERRDDGADVTVGNARMRGHVVTRREANDFYAAWGHPFHPGEVERMTKELEDAEIEANTRAHEERERLTDEHQKGEGDGYKRRD